MTMLAPERNVFVEPQERRQAHALLETLGGPPRHLAVDDNQGRTQVVPAELARLVARVLEVVASGGQITIASLPEELSTTVAADQLGVSRPTLMKMIQRGEIPAHKVGSHHRLKWADVQAARRARLAEQRRALAELRELADLLEDDD